MVALIGIFVDQVNRCRKQNDTNNGNDTDHYNDIHVILGSLLVATQER